MSRTIHICLATSQMQANLIPILALKPDYVIQVASRGMQEKSRQFAALLAQIAPDITLETLDGLPDSGTEAIETYALETADYIENKYPSCHIDFNTTGGTKQMVLIFADVFHGEKRRLLYADTRRQQIEQVRPVGKPIPMDGLINLETYLRSHNLEPRRADSDDETWVACSLQRQPLTLFLARHCDTLKGLLSHINWAANKAVERDERKDHLRAPQQHFDRPVTHALWREALGKMNEAQVLDWHPDEANTFYFKSLKTLRYLSGGWLEEYAWFCARQAGVQEVRCGLEVTDKQKPKDNVRNELDCVLCHQNHLLVIECKTARLGINEQSDSQIIYQLSSVGSKAAGEMGSLLLLSAHPIDRVNRDNRQVNNSARAEAMNIHTLAGEAVQHLPDLMKSWMQNGYIRI